jgi:hypothetical protein
MLHTFETGVLLASKETRSFPIYRNTIIFICPLQLKNSAFWVHFTLFRQKHYVSFFKYRQPKATNIGKTHLLPTLRTVHAKERNCVNFPNNYISDKELSRFCPEANWSKFSCINIAWSKGNVSLIWADWFLLNMLQLMFRKISSSRVFWQMFWRLLWTEVQQFCWRTDKGSSLYKGGGT